MFWTFSFQLLPDEELLEDSTSNNRSGVRAAYSVFLTNRRALFRFDGLGSSLTQSFFYHEILDVLYLKRLFVPYLKIRTSHREYLFNVQDAENWAGKIRDRRKSSAAETGSSRLTASASPERKKRELMDMLVVLRKNSLLTDSELEEKIHMLDSIKP